MSRPQSTRRLFLKSTAASFAGTQALSKFVYGQEAPSATNLSHLPFGATGQVQRISGEVFNDDQLLEDARQTRVAGQSDVLVCGGGPAGIAAAIAAARAGARVQLLELAGCLGGIWTAGMLTKILDSENKEGIMREILDAMVARGGDTARNTKGSTYDPELMKVVLEELIIEAGVRVQLHTQLVGALVDDQNRLVAAVTESKSGRQAWLAERFIDCTGDGDLAAHAGCQFDLGSGPDCACQPMSMMALLSGIDPNSVSDFSRDVKGPSAKSDFLNYLKSLGINPSYGSPTLRHIRGDLFSLMANHEYGVSAFDAGQVTEATFRARREIHSIVNKLRQVGSPWSETVVVATAEQIGIREGRRIRGRYTITGDDIVSGLRHEEAVCRAKFGFDVHNVFSDGSNPEEAKRFRAAGAKAYDIPLPALIAKDVDGLMMAGRCISGDFLAHSSYRVTGNSVPMGEAAGLVSAVSLRKGVLPHELSWKDAFNSVVKH